MRILSWNVNGIRAMEKKGFCSWLVKESPDMICLQETKAHPRQLTKELLQINYSAAGQYFNYWASAEKGGYSGVAIYSKKEASDIRQTGITKFDTEGRLLQADFNSFTLISAYFPNAQDEGKRISYKIDFCEAVMEICRNYVKNGRHFILSGDYNIAHKPIDLARPKLNENNPGYLPEEREWMEKFTNAGFTDTFRYFYPDLKEQYTWWSYRMKNREKNLGWRIDYHCTDNSFLPEVESAAILSSVQGSDHCPIEIRLK